MSKLERKPFSDKAVGRVGTASLWISRDVHGELGESFWLKKEVRRVIRVSDP